MLGRDVRILGSKVIPKSPVGHVLHGERVMIWIECDELDEAIVVAELVNQPLVHEGLGAKIAPTVPAMLTWPRAFDNMAIWEQFHDAR